MSETVGLLGGGVGLYEGVKKAFIKPPEESKSSENFRPEDSAVEFKEPTFTDEPPSPSGKSGNY